MTPSIQAPVGRGRSSSGRSATNRPDDVAVIQSLLSRVPKDSGGTTPAIPVTGAFDDPTFFAICRFQQRQFNWADGVVDPGDRTLARLIALAGPAADPKPQGSTIACTFPDAGVHFASFALILGKPAGAEKPPKPLPPLPPVPPDPFEHAKPALPVAGAWITNSLRWVRTAHDTYTKYVDDEARAIRDAVDRHYHFSRLPERERPAYLATLLRHFTAIQALLQMADTLFDSDLTWYPPEHRHSHQRPGAAWGYAALGGFFIQDVKKKVYFLRPFALVKGMQARAYAILHECAHSAASAVHYARNVGGGSGYPDHSRSYDQLDPPETLANADTYATFAAHAGTGKPGPEGDIRPGTHDPNR